MIKILFSSNKKVTSFIITTLFIAFYDYIYKSYMYEVWGYMGVIYHDCDTLDYILFILLSASPILFYKGLINIASAFSIFIFVFGFIPCYHALFFGDPLDDLYFLAYAIAFYLCMVFIFATDSLYLLKRPFLIKSKRQISIHTVEIITLIMMLIYIVAFASSMSFVNFFEDSSELYKARAAKDYISVAGIITYFPQWLTNAFLPFLLMIYLRQKNPVKVALIVACYVLVFCGEKSKITLLLPIVIIGLYYIVKHDQSAMKNYFYSGLISIVSLISWILVKYSRTSAVCYTLAAIFVMRSVCVEGWLCGLYLQFFKDHPYTYYTHINLINYLTQAYPYPDSVGRAVGGGEQNANAIFWLMDGVAACGPYGIYIVSALFILVKCVLNSISLRYNKNICMVIFLPAIISLLNVSLFTAILTCGILMLYLLFYFVRCPELQITKNTIR